MVVDRLGQWFWVVLNHQEQIIHITRQIVYYLYFRGFLPCQENPTHTNKRFTIAVVVYAIDPFL